MMQFGFNAPSAGPLCAPEALARIAQAGEALGFDYLTLSDHVVIPNAIASRYPYTESGEFPSGATAARHEQLIEMAWVAAKTSRIRLVTSVLVVPHRPAVLAAKQLSTIDVLSGGRVTVGIGAGWCEEEFVALGTPPFAERGLVTDEYVAAFKALWTQPNPRFEGKYVRFGDLAFDHKPVQRPHPPIWVGGESGPAMRRAARMGDAWYPIGTNPAFPLDSIELVEGGIAKLRRMAVVAGRAADAVGVVFRIQGYGPGVPARASDGGRRLFSGAMADVVGDIRRLAGLGVRAVDVGIRAGTAEEAVAELTAFRDEVIAKV
jgi:probable F420-dependent oxidoreductase